MNMQIIWGWQPALYLFLGGVGAGTFLAVGVLYFRDHAVSKRLLAISSWAALGCLGIGLLLLLSELTAPLRGLMMWQSFSHATSWMTIGAWLAFFAMVDFFVCATMFTIELRGQKKGERVVGQAEAIGKSSASKNASTRILLKVVLVAGMILALGVAVYTGMLLMSAPGVDLWNTALLPCLFTVSALDTGVALVEIVSETGEGCALPTKQARFLRLSVIALVSAEICFLVLFAITSMGGSAAAAWSMNELLSGSMAPWFWILLVGVGLTLPLGAAVAALHGFSATPPETERASARSGEVGAVDERAAVSTRTAVIIGAVAALLGGCALRFLVLFAGSHGDLIANTIMQLPF